MVVTIPTLGIRLGITPEAWWDLHPESRGIIEASCLSKTPFTAHGAKMAVRSMAALHSGLHPYRCPFVLVGEDHHHVGHTPSVKTLGAIARTIRDIHHDRPTPRKRNHGHRPADSPISIDRSSESGVRP